MINLPKDVVAQFDDFKKYACRMKVFFDRCDRHRQLFTIDETSFNTSTQRSLIISLWHLSKTYPNRKNIECPTRHFSGCVMHTADLGR